MKRKKRPLLVVEWDDTTTNTGWNSENDDYTGDYCQCVAVGWKLKSNKRCLVLATMRDDVGKSNHRHLILRNTITNIRRLE